MLSGEKVKLLLKEASELTAIFVSTAKTSKANHPKYNINKQLS